MKFGLFGGARASGGSLSDSVGYKPYLDYVVLAEELGYTAAFMVEHHFTGISQVSASLNVLTYLAAKTSRIRLGTAVVVLPWHNPVLLAEQVATIDLLSGGRFDFGVGKGYKDTEFAGFCIPMDEAQERFDEAMTVLRQAWTSEERFSHHGRWWNFENIVVEPRPVQNPHPPFWMAASSEGSIRKAARDGYNLLLDQVASIESVIDRVAIYREEQGRCGIAPKPQQIGVTRALRIVLTEEEKRQAWEQHHKFMGSMKGLARGKDADRLSSPSAFDAPEFMIEEGALIGDPQEIIGRLKRLEAGGVDFVLLSDVTGSAHALRVFAAEVMPAFEASPAKVAKA